MSPLTKVQLVLLNSYLECCMSASKRLCYMICTSYYLQYSNFNNKLLFTVRQFQLATICNTAISTTSYYLQCSYFNNKLLFTVQQFQQATIYNPAISTSYYLQCNYFNNKLLFTVQQFQQATVYNAAISTSYYLQYNFNNTVVICLHASTNTVDSITSAHRYYQYENTVTEDTVVSK